MSLQQELENFKAEFALKAPEEKQQTYEEFITQLGNSDLLDQALQVGQLAKDFSLSNALGESVNLFQLLEHGPVVLTWYRGGWCPYCNLTLHALQSYLPKFKELRASLVALTPELPDKSLTTGEKHNLEFEVLTDHHNEVARSYGVVFRVPPEVMAYYNQGFDLHEFNGDSSDELPLAATYIIDSQGVIQYAYLDADYRRRAAPEELVTKLQQMQD
jgi:peroxiredoxin